MTKPVRPADADELAIVKHTLGTLISWMAQSAVSPIGRDEAEKLLKKLSAQKADDNAA